MRSVPKSEANVTALLDSIRRTVDEIESRGDPDEILAVDDGLWEITQDAEWQRRRREATTAPRDCGFVSQSIARTVAYGRIE